MAKGKYLGVLVEYLDHDKLRCGLVVREQAERVTVLDAQRREKLVERELVLLRHTERKAEPETVAAVLGEIEQQRTQLRAELDLELLWEVVREQGRSFSAAELAELFFGSRSTVGTAVVLEALLNDRLYFVRRHMEFVPQSPEQVERLRLQQERIRLRSEAYRKTQALIRQLISDGRLGAGAAGPAAPEAVAVLVEELRRYLANPSTRSRDLTAMLSQAAPELSPAETAYEILDRLGAAPALPRFAVIGGLRMEFSPAALDEARSASPAPRPVSDRGFVISIDDPETREVDDALSCEMLADGGMRVRIHIALVSDFVAKGGTLDKEAAARAATVYLPEATILMLPEEISCDRSSLVAGTDRPVLTTDVRLSADGELLDCSIYPGQVRVAARLAYEQADRLLAERDGAAGDVAALTVGRLYDMAMRVRERRRRAGAVLIQRRETKVRVCGDTIDVQMVDAQAPSRLLVAEFMVLSNFVAARFAAENNLPIIYRVQPGAGGDLLFQRPRLSLYPEFHAGIGLDFYAQASSPIRRYADLVLQRQLVAGPKAPAYRTDELMTVLANAENVEVEVKELERRAKRYWILRYLERHGMELPLAAIALREGASAELLDYGVRGTLRGAPICANDTPILVRIARVDPLRGWLAFDYLTTQTARPRPAPPG